MLWLPMYIQLSHTPEEEDGHGIPELQDGFYKVGFEHILGFKRMTKPL